MSEDDGLRCSVLLTFAARKSSKNHGKSVAFLVQERWVRRESSYLSCLNGGVRLTFPAPPSLPDDDPLVALRSSFSYARVLLEFVVNSPVHLIGVSIAILLVGGVVVRQWTDTALPLLADAVPMLIAVAGVVMSYKQPKRENHLVTTIVLIMFGLVGTSVMSWTRIRGEKAHKVEMGTLQGKVDLVQHQNTDILTKFVGFGQVTPKSPQEREAARRESVLQLLRNEYILSHDKINPGILGGIELPPTDWLNTRLHELGEVWSVAPPRSSESTVAATPLASPAAIDVTVAVSDKNEDIPHATYFYRPGMSYIEQERACNNGLQCYPERDFTKPTTPIDVKIGDKGWARVFFLVYNVGSSTVPHPTARVNITGLDAFVNHVNQRQLRAKATEFYPNATFDLVPFSKSQTNYEYPVDVTVGPLTDSFVLLFQIYGENLTSHDVPVTFHVVRF